MTSLEDDTKQDSQTELQDQQRLSDGQEANAEEAYQEPETLSDFLERENGNKDRFPFGIVWNAIPVISWLVPILGHVGICDSQGRIWDFQKTDKVGINHMQYGRPMKIWRYYPKQKPPKNAELEEAEQQENLIYESRAIPVQWDKAIETASQAFIHRKMSWTKCNSWHHVCECLNDYQTEVKYTPRKLLWTFAKKGSWPSFPMALTVYLPPVILILFILILVFFIQILRTMV
ncbi:putative Protein of unknown function (DUF778) [Monocercomonoides exilis]|uniref:putative Protein of unknown function (DUF778) n=1 Tax=Monocercomonoides exilis TaxID=2049356 RepID=UPI003559E160|nr:putative Protein of unknown function (DUF778) [Monocercomonoides exilis]|eukprot:MONOS_14861.1-p1 / transcript=MONOS_14861.1 / gene=MONOS_14861 / organism=Monocercomonoides_exilis_PA203 / gene_product=transmembrane protein / transcript_product=transmembrane protein / location=Mono_scaffold01088:13002-14001(+) / protein_length=231 / sequence_SO=supercontig / SO=protein_coding / is_pseudo=false